MTKAFFMKAKLDQVQEAEHLDRAKDDPRYRERRFLSYRKEVVAMTKHLDGLAQECLNFRELSLADIVANNPPLGFWETTDDKVARTYYGLIGEGYIGPPFNPTFKIEKRIGSSDPVVAEYDGVYYTGFTLPDKTLPGDNNSSESFELKPYFSGKVFNETTEELVTRGETTNEIATNLAAILSPSGLPPHQIGYATPFVIRTYAFFDFIHHDSTTGNFAAQAHTPTHFCTTPRGLTEFQFLHKPGDIYGAAGQEKTAGDCVRYGDTVYLAMANATSMGSVFSVVDPNATSGAPQELRDPTAPGSISAAAFQWKIQSAIPFSGKAALEDPKDGDCIEIKSGDASKFDVVLQNMGVDNRWLSGGRGGVIDGVATVDGYNIFAEQPNTPYYYLGTYLWEISRYERAHMDMNCDVGQS